MALQTYPDYLPLPLQEGYGLSTVDPLRATTMATGRPMFRVMYTSVPTQVKVFFNFSESEAGLFEHWWFSTLNTGFEWFEIKLQTPAGFKKYKARFVGIYEGPDLTQITRWRYSATLLLIERPSIPDGWAGNPSFWLNKSKFDISMNKDWPKA